MHRQFLRNDHGQQSILAIVLETRRCTLAAGRARVSHSRFAEGRDRTAPTSHLQEFHIEPTSKVIMSDMPAHLQKVQKANGPGPSLALTRPRL
jgi:hypothetical protein